MKPHEKEMLTFLQNYLRINTMHPNPDYAAVLHLFEQQAQIDGFNTTAIKLPSGRPMLIIYALGSQSDLPALALNHHMDVVPIEHTALWITDPFGGNIIDDIIIGRGIQDMKGVGVAQYFALRELMHEKKLQRTVYLLCVPDEEIGGFTGTKEFVEHPIFSSLNIGYILDEGLPSGDPHTLYIKIAERKPFQIRISSQEKSGHASHLMHANSIHQLISALYEIRMLHTYNMQQHGDPGAKLSLHITSFNAGIYNEGIVALNVIPSHATATIDIRIPASIPIEEIKVLLETIIRRYSSISYTIEATIEDYHINPEILKDTDVYRVLTQSIQNHGLIAKAHYFEATTDLRYYQALGIIGLGCTPFVTQENLHGINESLPLNDLIQGKEILKTFLTQFCTHMEVS